MINLLLEISPILPDGSVQTLHLSSREVGPEGTQFGDGYQWLPLITQQPSRTVSWSDEGVLGETSVSYTPVVFEMSDEIGVANEHWSTWQWTGAYCRIWRGDEGQPFSAYTQIYEGSAGAIERSGSSASLPLLSIDHLVDRNLLTRTYGGTNPAGGPEGPSTLRGVLKPFAAGVCANVEPILVDRVAMIYQYHGYGQTAAIDAVYENAFSLDAPFATATTWAELAALTIPDGKWAAAPAIGAFRLANQPTGKITADVAGALDGSKFPTTVGAIMALIIKTTGVNADRVASSLKDRTEEYCLYTTEQTVVGDELRAAMLACGCAAMPSRDGKYSALDFYALNPSPIKLNGEVDVFPVVRSYRQLNVAPPIWQVKIAGERCWSTHSETEISQAVAVISADLEAKALEIKDALDRADLAQASANAQAKRIDDMLSDGILDRGEKARENDTFEQESVIKVEMMNRSTQFDVAAQRASYLAAFNNLSLYLSSLNPSFFDLTQNTPITSSYADYWAAYELAKVTLANAMTGDASRTSTWTGVTGVGRPADYATVGAPEGTAVGGRPVKQVLADIDKALADASLAQNDTTPPGATSTPVITSTLTDAGADVTITWTGPTDADLAGYDLSISENAGGDIVYSTPGTTYKFPGKRNTVYRAKVRAYDKASNPGVYSTIVTYTTVKDTVPPAAPSAVTVEAAYNTAFVSFTAPGDLDTATVTVNLNDASGTLVKTIRASVTPSARGQVTFASLTKSTQYSITTLATDSSGNNSTSTAPQPFATSGGINLADFTPGMSGNETVISLPTTGNFVGRVVFLQSDNKLYRYTSTGWTASVAAVDLTGQIPDNQIQSLTSIKITGKLTNDQLAAISADKITGVITETQIGENSISTGKIRANAVTATEIASGAITARTLAIGNFDNIIPDGDYRDPNWWNNNNPDSRLSVEPVSFTKFARALVVRPNGGIDVSSAFFAVEPGATYKISMGLDVSADFNGIFRPVIHMPGVQWHSIKAGSGFEPSATDAAFNYTVAGTSLNLDQIFTNWSGAEYNNRWQFRLLGSWMGTVKVAFRIIRVSDATLIADGAVTTNKITVNTLDGDRIRTNSLNADKIVANSITAGKLSIQTKPISMSGVNLRWDSDNVVRWDNGTITYPDINGNYITKSVIAGGQAWNASWDRPVNFCFNTDLASSTLGYIYYSTDLASYQQMIVVGVWNASGSDFLVKSGVSTLVNGDRIITGSIQATKIAASSITATQIAAGAITADKIQAGTITAAQLAAGAISASKLLVTSMTNLNADPGFRDTKYWSNVGPVATGDLGTSAGSTTGWYNSHGPDINALIGTTQFVMLWEGYFKSASRQHLFSVAQKNIRAGATYSLSAFCRNASNDTILVYCRFFNVDSAYISDVAVSWGPGEWSTKSTQFTAPTGVNSYQFIVFNLTTGNQFAGNTQVANLQVVEAIGATTILDGAITTNKITVNSLNGDRIAVGSLNADRITANTILSNTVTVSNTTGNLGDAVVNAQNAVANINLMTNDNVLSKSEKSELVSRWQIMEQRWIYVRDTASTMGLSYAVLDGAHTNLANYLTGLSPAWADTSTDTPMDGAYLRVLFNNYSAALEDLDRSIKNTAASRSTWNGVSGPEKPENYATKGAPAGTLVGNTEAQAVVNNAATGAADPATRINANTTTISPGKILIAGATTLASWRGGGDNTQIAGGAIAANTIAANKLTIGNRGLSVLGCEFEWTPATNTVSWKEGYFYYQNDSNLPSQVYINAGNTGGALAHRYFYWTKDSNTIFHSQTPQMDDNTIMVASWWGGSALNVNFGNTIINGDRITTNTINANRIVAGSITATQIAASAITAEKLNVTSLSAISANIGSLVSYNGAGGRVERDGNGTRIYDNNGRLRSKSGF